MERDGVTVFAFGRINPVPSTQLCCPSLCLHQHLAVCKKADPGSQAPSRSTCSFFCPSLFPPLALKAQVSTDKAAEVELQLSHWEGRNCSSHGWVFPAFPACPCLPCLSLPAPACPCLPTALDLGPSLARRAAAAPENHSCPASPWGLHGKG